MQRSTLLTFAVLAITGGMLYAAADRMGRFEASHYKDKSARPRVQSVRPADDASNVLPIASIGVDLHLPDIERKSDANGVDPQTITDASVFLKDSHGVVIPGHANTSGGNDALVFTPSEELTPGETYTFYVSDKLADTNGQRFSPFTSKFTVAKNIRREEFPISFEKVELNTALLGSVFTAVTIGPDNRLYAATFDGRILRYEISGDGTLHNAFPMTTVIINNQGPRLVTGLTFFPDSTASDLRLVVSHGKMVPPDDTGTIRNAPDFTGKISVLSGANLEKYHDMVTCLPRAFKDHMNYQPAFGPDGALYWNQGSHTSVGSPDNKWGMRSEHALSSACLRLDWKALGDKTLDAKTEEGGTYDPFAPGAVLTVYASGVRSAFDLLLHSNGRFYSAINGAAAGGNTPTRPKDDPHGWLTPIAELDVTTDDTFIALEKNRFYGHPNPSRGQYVLMGGNPTNNVDPFEISAYPVGTDPEVNWSKPLYSFGKNASPDGLLEYKTPGPLQHAVLVVRYSAGDDIIALIPRPDGTIGETLLNIEGFTGFTDPLDIVEDQRNGNIYVTEFGGMASRITLLRPRVGVPSDRVYRIANK